MPQPRYASASLMAALDATARTIGGTVYNRYSCNGMFGAVCIAIVGPSELAIGAALSATAITANCHGEASAWLHDAQHDTLGKDIIVYAPGWIAPTPDTTDANANRSNIDP